MTKGMSVLLASLLCSLLCPAALAAEPAGAPQVVAPALPEPPASALPSGAELGVPAIPTVRDRIDEAVRLRQSGQNAAASALLDALEAQVGPELRGDWLHQRGICAEVVWDYETAAALHLAAVEAGGDSVLDSKYRLALCLEALGRDAEAVQVIRELSRLRGLEETDALAVAIQRGTTEVRAGRVRRGVRRLEKALATAEAANLHSWLRAKAQGALAEALFEEAADVRLRGSEKRVVARLKERAALITEGEDHILEIIALEEVEWVLDSLLDIGAAYETLGSDLLVVRAPRGVDPDAYRAALLPYVHNVDQKAATIYGLGVDLAVRLGWESPRVGRLREERDRLLAANAPASPPP